MAKARLRQLRLRLAIGATGLMAVVAAPLAARAQLLPSLPRPAGRVLEGVTGVLPRPGGVLQDVRSLAGQAIARARALARRYPDRVALDPEGNAVRAGEVTVIGPDAAVIEAAGAAGFHLIEQVELEELGLGFARFQAPRGLSVGSALERMREIAGGREVSADPIYFASGKPGLGASVPAAPERESAGGRRIGIVDGGVSPRTIGLARQQGFAAGAPRANDHAAAIASLLAGGGGIRASAPGAALYVADVYGSDPAGGNATAISRALAWMVRERVPVVVVSLVGPANPLLGRVVAAARVRGTLVVAPVGNDGPAAPPAYPASYPQAIAVTGVDSRRRVLVEAGRSPGLDYAAPGSDMMALDAGGRVRRVRGTSFAAPFVAARLAASRAGGPDAAIRHVDGEALDLGRRGPDPVYGRGLVCESCATRR